MASTKANDTENHLQVEHAQHIGKIQSLLSTTLQRGNNKNSGSTSKRYKALLTCVICTGDAHGN